MSEMIARLLVLLALAGLTGCAAQRGSVPFGAAPSVEALQPDHGGSALPGSTLPCGFARHHSSRHEATCPVAINIHVPALRNPHLPPSKIPGLHPADIVALYGFPSQNAGRKVAIVDAFDDRRAESDMNEYRSEFGLPPCTVANGCFKQVNQMGRTHSYPHSSRAWSQEIALDLEMVSAVCPKCSILLVEANSASIPDLGAAVDEAVALGATIVSNSYYAQEWPGETQEDSHYNHPGVAITVSSGDKAAAYYPASSPFVTTVGATSLQQHGKTTVQTAWRYSGQGCSAFEPRPSFQPALCTTRSAVDMAVVGDPLSGVAIFSTQSGGWVVAGGTSVGAPVVAAAYALSGRPAGPAFSYARAGDFTSVGGDGFDLAGGLGTPIGVPGL